MILGVLGLLRGARWLSLAALCVGTGTLLAWAPGFPEATLGVGPWSIRLAGDSVALGLWALALVLQTAILWSEWGREGPFHALVTMLVGTSLALVLSRDLFNLYVCLELTSLLSFLLVGYHARPEGVWASLQYLILTTCGMILYLFGLGLVYARTGTLALSQLPAFDADPVLAMGTALLLSGAAVKGGVFLLGLWLPRAHGRAPHSISALLSGLVVKMGIVALYRIATALEAGPALAGLGLLTGLGGLAYALWETDIKYFLAFSTVSQLGYVLIGFGLGSPLGALLYAVGHGLFKALLFLSAGRAIEEAGTRKLAGLAGGLSRATAVGLAVGAWAIVGLPPLPGYLAKEAVGHGLPAWGKGALLAMGVGTAAAFAKLLPLLRPAGERRGRLRGEVVLILALAAFSGWGFSSLAPSPASALKAALSALAGLALHPALGRLRPRLPRPTLDRGLVGLLVGTVGIALGLLFALPLVP